MLTPKEKAEELVNKYFQEIQFMEYHNHLNASKQFALISVNEILWEIIKYADNSREYVVENSIFWQEVKQEIELL
jgi:hypothetical protein